MRGAWIEMLDIGEVGGENVTSLPVRGAWIEILQRRVLQNKRESLPVRGAWIEIEGENLQVLQKESLPVRGAWIEIIYRERNADCCIRRSPCGERGLK